MFFCDSGFNIFSYGVLHVARQPFFRVPCRSGYAELNSTRNLLFDVIQTNWRRARTEQE